MLRNLISKHSPKTTQTPDNESGLIQLYRETGEMRLLGELYEPYIHLVFGVCMKYLKNRQDSQDAVMQIFEKIVVDLRRHEVQHFKSWLYQVSKNYCLMELRRKKIEIQDENSENLANLMELSHQPHLTDEQLEKEQQLRVLEQTLEQLPPEQKQCVQLFFLEQKSYRQIAEQTDYDLKKVKSYIQNGKRKLKIMMTENMKH